MTAKFDINQIRKEMKAAIDAKVNRETHKLLHDLKNNTPVDTGRARDGWRIENGDIINDVEYIEELNHGSSKQAPSFFIERTLLADPAVIANGIIVQTKEK